MGVEVRTIQKDELPAWAEAMRVGFLGHVSEGEAEVMGEVVHEVGRTTGAFDGAKVVGTLRSFTTELSAPGGGRSAARRSPT